MRNGSGAGCGVVALGLASVLFLTSCARPSATQVPLLGDYAYLQRMEIQQFCDHPDNAGVLENLSHLEATEFTVDSTAVPAFSVHAGDNGRGAFVVDTLMSGVPDCRRFTTISMVTDHAEAIEIRPLGNWSDVAGADAVAAFERLEAECETLTVEEATRRFGNVGWRGPDGRVLMVTDIYNGCRLATQSLVYGIRIGGPDWEIVVSNVYGDVFVEEQN